MDLKPANILVSFEDAESPNIGKWKISDFGISIIAAVEEARPLHATGETFRYPFPLNGAGAYQPPETANGSAFGRKSDVWSLGCILVRVLAFGLDGETKLKELDDRRARGIAGEPEYYKHDFFHRGDPPVRNPHIEAWLRGLPDREDSSVLQDALTHFRDLLLHTLEINIEDRLTAGEVKKKLRDILPSLHVAELPPPPPSSLPGSVSSGPTSPRRTSVSTSSTTLSRRPSSPTALGISVMNMIDKNDTTQLPLLLSVEYDL
ncbi:kinase-like domain-containing protein [Aspergillus undulatus]|uniref:kinase-like domain-containing protein n=1 Tax=Aspergillus undulatus TaxID=1810928 RepID=UPI003CCDE2DB